MNKRQNHEIEVYLHHETDHAILVAEHNLRRSDQGKVWLPKSKVSWSTIRNSDPPLVCVQAPGWLIEERGLDHLV